MEPMHLVIPGSEDGYFKTFRRISRPGIRIIYASLLIGFGVALVAALGPLNLEQIGITVLCATVAAFTAYWVRFDRNLRKVLKANLWMVADAEMEISERGIRRKLKFQESYFEWPFFRGVIQTPEGMALMTGSNSFLLIPHAAMEGRESDIRALIERHHPIKSLR